MTSYLNDNDCVVQILACERDPNRLFNDISRHVAADRAKHAAVYEARVVVEAPNTGSHPQQDSPTRLATKLPSVYLGLSDLTLTLLHIDTTFRFKGACINSSSPGLAWPTIQESFASNAFVDDDFLLRAQYHHPDASLKPDVTPGSLLLHLEIVADSHADAVLLEIAEAFRNLRCSWSRQLLFSQDPARFRKNSDGDVHSVLMQEFDPQHTSETITAALNDVSLRRTLNNCCAEISIRLFSLVGTSSQRIRIPMDPADLPIQNRLYNKPSNDSSEKEPYFGLRAESYVQI